MEKKITWSEITESIRTSLITRGLKNPKIRLNALANIEEILKKHFSEYIENPQVEFGAIYKSELKEKLAKYKENGKLNSAEISIINEIYYRI
jgi:hypothetical protein